MTRIICGVLSESYTGKWVFECTNERRPDEAIRVSVSGRNHRFKTVLFTMSDNNHGRDSRDRRDYSSSSHFGGGGRGRGGFRGGRGGFRGGRGGGYRPYDNPNHRGRGPRRPGNRFAPEQQQQDPKHELMQNLIKMINRVGSLPTDTDNNSSESSVERSVVAKQAENIQQLTKVLCGASADLFFQTDVNSRRTDQQVGPLAAGIIHAVAVWPLQTPVYAALTLSVHEAAPISGFASRCLDYAMRLFARDLDSLVLVPSSSDVAFLGRSDRPHAVLRLSLILRYLALLAKLGIVTQHMDQPVVPAATHQQELSLAGLLEALVQAANQAHDRYANRRTAYLLAMLVLTCIPYVRGLLENDWIQEILMEPIERILETYVSTFAPGLGATAILLKGEQMEDIGADGTEEEEDEDDDDDDDEEVASGQVCDSLQDLLRAVQHMMKLDGPFRLALFSDAPWNKLKAPSTDNEGAMQDSSSQEDGEMETAETMPSKVLSFSGEPNNLRVFPDCKTLTLLLGGEVATDIQLARFDMEGLVFGRLPIFGAPPEMDDDDMAETSPLNERLDAYRKEFGLVDRYFISELIRSVVISNEMCVTDAGVEHGSSRAVAEQVWSICQAITDKESTGTEYCIVEALLSLIVQAGPGSPVRLMYVARIVLELTRLSPSTVSQAIAMGVANLFQDYMPTLVPIARYNLSRWFAFHLQNTDYQWPGAYWKHYEPFVHYGWDNSRGAFVRNALSIMTENLSTPGVIVDDCLPSQSVLVDFLVDSAGTKPYTVESVLGQLEEDVRFRIHEVNEDHGLLLSYLCGDEASEMVASAVESLEHPEVRARWRTAVVAFALTAPGTRELEFIQKDIEQARSGENGMDEDPDPDPMSKILESLVRYKALLIGTIAHDSRDDANGDVSTEIFLLEQIAKATTYSHTLLAACVASLLDGEVVSANAILRWSLAESGDPGSSHRCVRRWWELALIPVRHIIAKFAEERNPTTSEMDTEEGNGDLGGVRRAKDALGQIDPLLSYAVQRVCSLLAQHARDTKKLSPREVDLLEGMKLVLLWTKTAFALGFGRGPGTNGNGIDAKEIFALSGIAGPKLAALCSSGGKQGSVELLRANLERM